jgi:N-formylglutamate amidohydrolase
MPQPVVLLLTHSGDFYVPERVQEELESRGARARRVDTDRYPAGLP